MKKELYELMELIAGLIFIFIGIIILLGPIDAINNYQVVFGMAAVIKGISNLLFFIVMKERTDKKQAVSLVVGTINISSGVFLCTKVSNDFSESVIWFVVWLIILCITKLFMIGYQRLISGQFPYWRSMIINLFGITFGVLMLFFTDSLVMQIGYCVGCFFIAKGINVINFTFKYLQTKKSITYH